MLLNFMHKKAVKVKCVPFFPFQIKAYREYERERKPINQLTEEDQFMLNLSKIDRLSTKLQIMSFIANFFDNIHMVTPVSPCACWISILGTILSCIHIKFLALIILV